MRFLGRLQGYCAVRLLAGDEASEETDVVLSCPVLSWSRPEWYGLCQIASSFRVQQRSSDSQGLWYVLRVLSGEQQCRPTPLVREVEQRPGDLAALDSGEARSGVGEQKDAR